MPPRLTVTVFQDEHYRVVHHHNWWYIEKIASFAATVNINRWARRCGFEKNNSLCHYFQPGSPVVCKIFGKKARQWEWGWKGRAIGGVDEQNKAEGGRKEEEEVGDEEDEEEECTRRVIGELGDGQTDCDLLPVRFEDIGVVFVSNCFLIACGCMHSSVIYC